MEDSLEIFDPCSQQVGEEVTLTLCCVRVEPADEDFLQAKSFQRQIKEARGESCEGLTSLLGGNKKDLCTGVKGGRSSAQENSCHFQEVCAAEDYLEISNLFTKLIHHLMENLKHRADRRRYSGSKSIAQTHQ